MAVCVYCMAVADSRDHVRPRCLLGSGVVAVAGEPYTVPACRHCNAILGAYPGYTVEDRRARVRVLLQARLDRLPMTQSVQEIQARGYGRALRRRLIRQSAHRAALTARLEGCVRLSVALSEQEASTS